MAEYEIRPLDLASDDDLAVWSAITAATDEHDMGGCAPLSVTAVRASLTDDEYKAHLPRLAFLDGEPVAYLFTELGKRDRLGEVSAFPVVHPRHRGTSVVERLAEELGRIADETGRRPSVWQLAPAEGDLDDPTSDANRFAAVLGLERKAVSFARAASLPLPDALLDEVRDDVDGYRIERWSEPVPERWAPELLRLFTRFQHDMPHEDEHVEVVEYTVERLRAKERRHAAMGTEVLIAVAIAPDGSLAAYSDVHVEPAGSLAVQEVTMVLAEHRGHGLGKAVKLATHAELSRRGRLTTVITWNSHVNPWMAAINERLGYRIRFREVLYE